MIRDYNHRFIFLLVNGYLPHHIDHIDQDKGNNLPTNLRAATSQENAFNCKLSKNNTSGVNGVYYENSRNKWVGKIKINYRNVDLKRFHSFEEAVKHRRYLEVKYEFNM